MAKKRRKDCERCDRLEDELQEMKERIARLEADLAKAGKNSSNSSKPPSSDITQPKGDQRDGLPKTGGSTSGKRKRGGQPGHP